VPLEYLSAAQVRADIAARYAADGLGEIAALRFGQPAPTRNWLQESNPAERGKWDVMFQDLPPVKGTVDPTALPLPPGTIRLNEVK